jgi:sugar lactone lactonase YvrE
MQTASASVAFEARAELGEGSLWDERLGRLYWVDIVQSRVHVFNPTNRSNLSFDVGQNVGTVVPTQNDKLLLALRDGFAWLDPDTGRVHLLEQLLADLPGERFNDGKCDPAGRFWAGTMVEKGPKRTGKLYCLDESLDVTTKIEGVTISNGLVWSSDQTRFYYIDTPTHEIVGYDFDVATGAIDNRSVVATIPAGIGSPDGMTIDADDQLWVALFHGASVLRIDPRSGEVGFRVEVPAKNVTSCAFGGLDLDELFITTARVGSSAAELAAQPLAGSLFSVRLPFAGVPAHRFARSLQS